MLHIKSLDEGLEIFKALGSEVRINIVKLLLENREMNMNELATASRQKLPLIEVIVNNHVLGMVRQWQTLFYKQHYSATVLDDGVDYVKIAEAMGAAARRVTTQEEFNAAFQEALESKTPFVIDAIVDSDDKVWPMVAPGAPINECFDGKDFEGKNK